MSVISGWFWRPGKLARDTVLLGAGLGLRALSQALVFLIVARLLGTQGYGAFSAALAAASIWSNFCGLGGYAILVRDVARDPARFTRSWSLTLAALGLSILPVLLLYLVSVRWFLPQVPWALMLALGLGELVFWPLANVAVYVYQGFERMGRSARMMLAPVLARLAAATLLLLAVVREGADERLVLWGWLYAAASLAAAIYAHHRVVRDLGRPRWPGRRELIGHIRAGVPFSLLGGAGKLYLDADKFLLARLAGLETAGLYSAGYRFVDLTFLPLHALIAAAVPRLFRAGANGTAHSLRAALPLLGPALAYAAVAGLLLFLAAPLIPRLLGASYEEAVSVVRWLAWLPLVAFPRLLMQSALATSDRQTRGMMIVSLGALANIGLNVWWIQLWGWRGAIAATYAAELVMVVVISSRRRLSNANEK